MKVWVYSYSRKQCPRKQLEKQRDSLMAYANDQQMEVMGITVLNNDDKSQLREVLRNISRLCGDGILIHNIEDLPHCDRTLLMDAIYHRKITIFCSKYSRKGVV